MKTRTKILIVVLFVVVYTALIIVVMREERKDGEIPDEYKDLFGLRRKYYIEVDYDKVISENEKEGDVAEGGLRKREGRGQLRELSSQNHH